MDSSFQSFPRSPPQHPLSWPSGGSGSRVERAQSLPGVKWIDEREDQLYSEPKVCIDRCACMPERPVRAAVEEGAVREGWTGFIAEKAGPFTPHPDEALALDRQR